VITNDCINEKAKELTRTLTNWNENKYFERDTICSSLSDTGLVTSND
jgi:hypothetical protein